MEKVERVEKSVSKHYENTRRSVNVNNDCGDLKLNVFEQQTILSEAENRVLIGWIFCPIHWDIADIVRQMIFPHFHLNFILRSKEIHNPHTTPNQCCSKTVNSANLCLMTPLNNSPNSFRSSCTTNPSFLPTLHCTGLDIIYAYSRTGGKEGQWEIYSDTSSDLGLRFWHSRRANVS